jgi:hypothetical protein
MSRSVPFVFPKRRKGSAMWSLTSGFGPFSFPPSPPTTTNHRESRARARARAPHEMPTTSEVFGEAVFPALVRGADQYGISRNRATAQSTSMSRPTTIRPCRTSFFKFLGVSSVAFDEARGRLASPSRPAPSEARCRAPGACPGSSRWRRGPRGPRARRRSRQSPSFTGPTPTPSSRAPWWRGTAIKPSPAGIGFSPREV